MISDGCPACASATLLPASNYVFCLLPAQDPFACLRLRFLLAACPRPFCLPPTTFSACCLPKTLLPASDYVFCLLPAQDPFACLRLRFLLAACPRPFCLPPTTFSACCLHKTLLPASDYDFVCCCMRLHESSGSAACVC
eukprot:XP_012810837.1 PREDICTED: keratin-associated protein 4-9-like [Xenopus tropicalis]